MYSRNRSKGTRRYWNNGYKRNAYSSKGYQTSNRSRMSIRVPVTETFNMAWSKPTLTINNTGAQPVPSENWAASNTTMVGCIFPYMGFQYDNQVNRYGNDAHPNLNATQVRIAAGRAAATQQKLYQIYTNMYDEVKLDGMTVSLSVLTPVGTTDLPSLSIATSWDRKVGEPEIAPLLNYSANAANLAINNASLYPVPAQGQTATYNMVISNNYPNTYQELIGGSSATEATAINNSVAKIFRSCKASDLMERNIFHDCTLRSWNTHADSYYDETWDGNAQYTNTIGFAPAFYFACKRPDVPAAADTTVTLQAEVSYYFTFRNPKFGGTTFDPVASASLLNRAIAQGAQEAAEAQRQARIRTRDMSDRGEEVLSPETESGAAAAAAAMDDGADQELVVHDETTQYQAPTKKTETMDSKTGTM